MSLSSASVPPSTFGQGGRKSDPGPLVRRAWLGVTLLAIGVFAWLFRYEIVPGAMPAGVAYRLDRWTGQVCATDYVRPDSGLLLFRFHCIGEAK